MSPRKSRGFTLVELMIVVFIIGALAAIAIPAFSRYVKKSRGAEAAEQLNKLWLGSVTYYMSDFTSVAAGEGKALDKQFPGPAGSWETTGAAGEGTPPHCCQLTGARCPGGSSVWASDAVWLALKFALPDPHTYMPGYSGNGTGTNARFTAISQGSAGANCGKWSTFSRQGYVTSIGDVAGQVQPTVSNETE
jgi:prepilin-type N-terminal cleavage/methylation domain-containing protein